MKRWIVPALAGVAIAGFVAGRSTASPRDLGPIPKAGNQETPVVITSEPRASVQAPGAPSQATIFTPEKPAIAPRRGHKAYLLEKLARFLEEKEEEQFGLLQKLSYDDQKLQRELFEIIKSTDDLELMQLCQDFPIGNKNPELLKEVIGQFNSEQNPQRRLAWGRILARNWQNTLVRPMVLDLLDGDDARLQERMLGWMSLQQSNSEVPADQMDRLGSRLRLMVKAGSTDALRAAAAGSLAGSIRTEDIQLLIDTMINDRNTDVQYRAFWSLPSHSRFPSPMLEEQLRGMYLLAVDETRTDKLRKNAAERALRYVNPMLKEGNGLNPAEKAALLQIIDARK